MEASREGAKELAGHAVDFNRARRGEGEGTFDQAVAALHAWKKFDLGRIRVLPPNAPIEAGTVVAVLARHHAFGR